MRSSGGGGAAQCALRRGDACLCVCLLFFYLTFTIDCAGPDNVNPFCCKCGSLKGARGKARAQSVRHARVTPSGGGGDPLGAARSLLRRWAGVLLPRAAASSAARERWEKQQAVHTGTQSWCCLWRAPRPPTRTGGTATDGASGRVCNGDRARLDADQARPHIRPAARRPPRPADAAQRARAERARPAPAGCLLAATAMGSPAARAAAAEALSALGHPSSPAHPPTCRRRRAGPPLLSPP